MDSLWIDFINSDWHDHLGQGPTEDRLDSPKWVRAFVTEHGLGRVGAAPASRAALKKLRTVMQRVAGELAAGKSARGEDLAALNRALEGQPVRSRLEPTEGKAGGSRFRITLEPTRRGLEGVLFAIARSFAEVLVDGEPARLRVCENPDCGWVFYDATRSRTRRWCGDSCGNLIKVRRFRAKQREAGSE